VHLAAIAAFTMVGLAGRVPRIVGLAFAVLAMLATTGRGAILAFACALSFALFLWPPNRRVMQWLAAAALLFIVVAASGVEFRFPGASRSISARAVTRQFASIFISTERSMDSTKQWRIEWWRDIIDDVTVGEHPLGRGFGYNLSEMHDVKLTGEQAKVRSPHNVHLTVMARAGIPGILLWVAVQGAWVISVLAGYFRAMAREQRAWAGVFLCLGVYWVACLVNGAFDVYIEGPMGGIWFWSIFGVGIAASMLHRADDSRDLGDLDLGSGELGSQAGVGGATC
jgi:O-antigen ligase